MEYYGDWINVNKIDAKLNFGKFFFASIFIILYFPTLTGRDIRQIFHR